MGLVQLSVGRKWGVLLRVSRLVVCRLGLGMEEGQSLVARLVRGKWWEMGSVPFNSFLDFLGG